MPDNFHEAQDFTAELATLLKEISDRIDKFVRIRAEDSYWSKVAARHAAHENLWFEQRASKLPALARTHHVVWSGLRALAFGQEIPFAAYRGRERNTWPPNVEPAMREGILTLMGGDLQLGELFFRYFTKVGAESEDYLSLARQFLSFGPESFETDCSEGFDIRGDWFDTMLLYNGRPLYLNWCDCEGSIGQLIIRSGSLDLETDLANYRSVVEGALDLGELLVPQIDLVTRLLTRGRYLVGLQSYLRDRFTSLWPSGSNFDQYSQHVAESLANLTPTQGEVVGYYPDNDAVLYALQEMVELDAERVHFYRELARRDIPLYVVTLRIVGGHCQFIIDGHHKFRACVEENRVPRMIEIERVDAPTVDSAMAKLAFGHDEALSRWYFSLREK